MSFLSYFYVTMPVLGWQNQNNLIISQLFVDQKFVVLFLKMLQVSRESFWQWLIWQFKTSNGLVYFLYIELYF